MPINVEFTTKKTKDEFVGLAKAILNSKGLHHKGADVETTHIIGGESIYRMTINGINALEHDIFFLSNLFRDSINEQDLSYDLTNLSSEVIENEVRFLSERYTPAPSLNSVSLTKIDQHEIPEEYCCPLSGSIMDNPCYDVRFPQYKFEHDFLAHNLKLHYRAQHPCTNVPMQTCHLAIDYGLREQINTYVKECKENYDSVQKTLLLEKFKNAVDLNQALRRAVSASETEKKDIDNLLHLGADINAKDDGTLKRTALHVALIKSCHNHVRLLISCGAKVDIPDAEENTFLSLFKQSSISNKDVIVHDLIAFNYVKPDYYDSFQKTLLLEKFKNAVDLNQALRRAVSVSGTEKKDIVTLLQLGADINAKDDGTLKRTALHVALIKSCHNHVRLLISCGAKVDIPDAEENTFLSLFKQSSISNKDVIVHDLIAFNYVKPDYYDSFQKTLLLEKFKNAVDLNQALRRAVSVSGTEKKDIVTLLQLGADINAKDDGTLKRTALHVALIKSCHNHVRLLISCGAKVDIPDAEENTFLSLFKQSSISNKDVIIRDLIDFKCVKPDHLLQSSSSAGLFSSSSSPPHPHAAQASEPSIKK